MDFEIFGLFRMATRGRLLLVMGVLALSALVLTSASERGSTGRTGSHGDGSDEGHDAERSAEGEIPNLRDELGNDTEGKVPPPKQEAPNLKKKGKTVLKGGFPSRGDAHCHAPSAARILCIPLSTADSELRSAHH